MISITQAYLKKNAPLFGAIGAVGGFVGDVLAPLANFASYLLIASLVGLAITVGYYYYSHKDGHVTKKEAALTKAVFFGFFTLVWGFFSFVHVVGPANGVVASTIPGVESLQESIGILEKDVAEIKKTTSEIKGDTEQILLELSDLKADLEAAGNGSIKSKPGSAEDWYGNAILYAAQGKEDKSVEAYQEFFEYGYPYIDAYQGFNLVAKNELSKSKLSSYYDDLAKSQPTNVVAQLMVGALIKNTDDRREYYDDVREEQGDSAVLLYWLMNEYSAVGTYVYANELSTDETQQWTTSDQSALKDIVGAYEALPITDNLEPYFISTFAYDGAKTIINSFSNQFEDETVNNMLDNPLIIVANPTSNASEFSLTFVIYDSYTDILYRIPGVVDDFTSTIPTESDDNNPWASGHPDPETEVIIPMGPGSYDVEVYWKNINGKKGTVYEFTSVDFLAFSEWTVLEDKPVWVYPDK